MIESSVNSSQQSGSASTAFVKTGGRIATRERGSTGCGPDWSPSSSEMAELERRRLIDVFCVSARASAAPRDATEPRWCTEA